MISGAEPFIKPCAFGAPRTATGLDQRLRPAVGVCRAINAALSPSPRRTFLASPKKVL